MSKPDDAKIKWLAALSAMGGGNGRISTLLAAGEDGLETESGDRSEPPKPAARAGQLFAEPARLSADTGKLPANGPLVRVRDDDPVAPAVKNLDLPTVENNLMDIIDRESDEVEKMLWSEIKESAYYVDNGIQSLTVLPEDIGDVMNLTVKKMRLKYSGGRKLSIHMDTVSLGTGARPKSYERRNGFIIPLDAAGKDPSYDATSTPNVIICAQWINDEIARRKQTRQKIAELTSTFAGAVAGLGNAAAMGEGAAHPEGSRKLPGRSGRSRGGGGAKGGGGSGEPEGVGAGGKAGGKGEGNSPRGGGGSGKPAGGGDDVVPMRLDEPKGSGKPASGGHAEGGGGSAKPSGGKPAGPPKLGKIKQAKQDAHSYILSERNENPAVKDAAVGKGGKDPRELNQRVIKLQKVQDGKTPGASLLNKKYSDHSMQGTVGQKVQNELNAGRYTSDKNGGTTVILDMGEPTGWVVDGNLESQEVQRLDVRIDTKGSWHFFPTH